MALIVTKPATDESKSNSFFESTERLNNKSAIGTLIAETLNSFFCFCLLGSILIAKEVM